jgi:hypothetical protein
VADERKRRIAENEALFRLANERMARWEERERDAAVELYFCECGDPACDQKVALRRPDYERVRGVSAHFFVVPGHEIPDVETVVEAHREWLVVEKAEPEARVIAEQTDPRRD